jgi:transcriptional regulator with XRE-family HTH domain
MSPPKAGNHAPAPTVRAVARLALAVGTRVREERHRRRWSLRAMAARAGLSAAAVHAVESGRPASLDTYVRLSDSLGMALEVALTDRRRSSPMVSRDGDLVHAAMGELEVNRLSAFGLRTGVDEPYQHYQFAGRADVVAWDLDARALLHIENRTRFPDLQAASGAWNAKRAYLAPALADRLGVPRGWASVVHVMVALWSAEVLHTLRLRTGTFAALCPDPPADFVAWWSGGPPATADTATFVVIDPTASGRQRLFCGLDDALHAKPRHRGYADAADRLRATRTKWVRGLSPLHHQ